MTGNPGRLFVISGPAGGGKSSLVSRVLGPGDLPVRLSVSATTRRPRPGEVDGIHYHFWPRERFDSAIQAGEFLEWQELFGHLYGTLRSEVDPYLARGVSVLLEIDVKGAHRIRSQRPDARLIFVRVSSLDEYERRLRFRGTEMENELQQRIARAREELALAATYDCEIINDDLDQAVAALHQLLQSPGGNERVG